MKHVLIAFSLTLCVTALTGQTMKFIPLNPGDVNGACINDAKTKGTKVCYALEYTPKVSGTLTSYTTGFLVSCTSLGSAIRNNQSCGMESNVRVQDACSQLNAVLLNSSGNSGTETNNKVEADKPVILHQVCFQLPKNETITITEDQITDLTTAINGNDGNFYTEMPTFVAQVIGLPKYDVSRPTAWLDFQAIGAGQRVSQLDWTVSTDQEIAGFEIERSRDGNNFERIGFVSADQVTDNVNSFQYLDNSAGLGKNYYRLHTVTSAGNVDPSPVRWLTFDETPFSVSFTPNPADAFIMLNVNGAVNGYEFSLIDVNGRAVKSEKQDGRSARVRIAIDDVEAGFYTAQIKTGDRVITEKITVID